MKVEFDPAKDAMNIVKHGVSLARAADMGILSIVEDGRQNYGEVRFRAFGTIDGILHCLAFTYREEEAIRAISLRRAHAKEMKRYVP